MAHNYDLEASDKNIEINTQTDPRNVQLQAGKADQNPSKDFIQKQKESYATTMVQSATEQVTKSWYEKFLCGMDFLKQFFNVTTAEVRSRLLHSLVPFNPKFHDISEQSPDLYGPFWIYTTLVFIIAAAGSLAKYIKEDSSKNFFQEFVPLAAGIIYGIGFGLPIVLTILMKCFGSSTSFLSVICTYGYSFSIFIPVVIACSVPIDLAQWILIAYAVFSSTSFLLVNYWKELSKYMEKKRYIILAVVIACQAGLFLTLKLYFFEKFNKEQNSPAVTPSNNNSKPSNSTLLF